jgi:hypothetical protein
MRAHCTPSDSAPLAGRKQSRHKRYAAAVVAIATIATMGGAGGPAAAGPSNTPEGSGLDIAAVAPAPDGPQLLDDAIGDLVVRLHGSVCSGTPISGTVYVVTAAHCVLTNSGVVTTRRTVVRDTVRYSAVEVLVDTRYHDHPSVVLDAAVLVMDRVIPGPSAQVGLTLPATGRMTLAGFQPIDNGSLLRGHDIHDRTLPRDATGTLIKVPYRPAGCVVDASTIDVSAARVMVPCGLMPGASGGGLYVEHDGEFVLVGILSTVTVDLTSNGVVPLASLHELLQHPERYTHEFSTERSRHDQVRSERV